MAHYADFTFDGGNENLHAVWNVNMPFSNSPTGGGGRKAGPIMLVLAQPIKYGTEVFDWWFGRNKVNGTIIFHDLDDQEDSTQRKIELTEAMCTSYSEFYNTGQYEDLLMLSIVIEVAEIQVGGTSIANV